MKIKARLETFQLDSRATANVLSKKTLKELFNKSVAREIEKTNAALVMYNGSEFKPIGIPPSSHQSKELEKVQCRVYDRKRKLQVYVGCNGEFFEELLKNIAKLNK